MRDDTISVFANKNDGVFMFVCGIIDLVICGQALRLFEIEFWPRSSL